MNRALRLELYILDDLGAVPHANSGAMAKKHDGSTDEGLVEVKTTGQKGFSIVKKYWDGLRTQAIKRRREPIMVIAFDDGKSSPSNLTKIAVIDYEYFKSLTVESEMEE